MKTIPKTRPVEAKLIITALSGITRLQILRILIESREALTASEISSRLGLSLPTTLVHINQLASAGLIKWIYVKRGKRLIRAYRVPERDLVLSLDLYALALTPSLDELDELLEDFLNRYRELKELPSLPSLEEVEKVLKVNRYTALALLDYLRVSEDKVAEKLAEELRSKIEERGEMSLEEVSKELRVHEYWAVQVARKLEEQGGFILERGTLRKIIE